MPVHGKQGNNAFETKPFPADLMQASSTPRHPNIEFDADDFFLKKT
jgi:hypothetical protein